MQVEASPRGDRPGRGDGGGGTGWWLRGQLAPRDPLWMRLVQQAERAYQTFVPEVVHPVEVAEPPWGQLGDAEPERASQTRRRFIETYCDTDVQILGSHFADPTAVHIVSTPQGRRVR